MFIRNEIVAFTVWDKIEDKEGGNLGCGDHIRAEGINSCITALLD